ncbi:hypothetical protein FBU31_000741 [Coemansia sp. 'formosensis']|nr:hypothetical protein FBU31_000741 [Coemansia sp. 'formosensis']
MSLVGSTRLSASSDSQPQSAVNSTFSSQDNGDSSNSASDDGEGDDSVERPAKRFKSESPNSAESSLTSSTLIDFAEHQGQRYFVGDHVLLDDVDNTSGTLGTSLPAVGHIQQLERDAQTGQIHVSVVWYVYPQLTPHPPLMEFYKNTLLRTLRQTTVPLDRVKRPCFVVQPAEAMVGHPAEYVEGVPLFMCDSRYNDKGGFIQKIKNRARGYWPADMDQKRQEMLTTMVAWLGGPRELEKSLVPILTGNDEHGDGAPQTRRSSRLVAPASTMSTPQQGAASSPAMNNIPLPPQNPTTPLSQSQYLAYQQMLVQSQILPLSSSGVNGQPPPPPFMLNGATINATTPTNGTVRAGPGIHTSPTPPLPLILPPKRRGRPPKNKQLIEQRALEDAAKMIEIAALIKTPPGSQLRSSTRHQQPSTISNGVRPPIPPPGFGATNGLSPAGQTAGMQRIAPNGVGAHPSPAQLLAARVQPVAPVASQLLQQQQQQKLVQQQSQLQQQKQQQQHQQFAPLPHMDSASIPQLPKDIVDLFPTADGKLKWFAALPVCRPTESSGPRHSDAYNRWKQGQAGSST